MNWLNGNWITEPIIDFEYKKYKALAYLKDVGSHFSEKRIFPFLSDLTSHWKRLKDLSSTVEEMQRSWPHRLEKLSLHPPGVNYQLLPEVDKTMAQIQYTVDYVLPLFNKTANTGQNLSEELMEKITIEPIGLEPLDKQEGYLFVWENSLARLYRYRIRNIKSSSTEEDYRDVITNFLQEERVSIAHTVEKIKTSLIMKYRELPNPATYLVTNASSLPVMETVLPLAKQWLLRSGENQFD